MCAGAAYWAQFKKIVFGARDLKRGYFVFTKKSILQLQKQKLLETYLVIKALNYYMIFFQELKDK